MISDWNELKFWKSGEYQVVEERLADLTKKGIKYCPGKKNLFLALRATPFQKCRVVLCGQDPYPNPDYAMGLSFSVPEECKVLPASLKALLQEYSDDLSLPLPRTGSLIPWSQQGVLLWNVIPSCTVGHSLSHDWEEWKCLTQEMFDNLKEKGVVFILLGSAVRGLAASVKSPLSRIVEATHPSPRASLSAREPFKGSKIFSKCNSALKELGQEPIDWRLM